MEIYREGDMKILHINNLASVSYNLCKGLNELGHKADMFQKGNEITDNQNSDWIYTSRNKIQYYTHCNIDFSNYDIVHIHHPITLNTSLARIKSLINDVPCVIHFHGSITSNIKNLTKAQKIADRISTYNPSLENRVLIFTEMYQFKKLDKWIPIIKKLPYIQFDIIDRGKDRNYYKAILPSNVNYIPSVTHHQIYSLLSKYPLVLGQRNNVMSISELESMSAGIPTLFDWDSDSFYSEPLPIPDIENEDIIIEHIGNSKLGNKQKKWVRNNHEYLKVSKHVLKLYYDIIGD
jgi:hypothetical protein